MKRCKNKSNIEILRSYLNNERPFVQVGYTPDPEPKRKDNEIWTDKNGIEWIQKGAAKISKKLYDAREATRQVCTSCKKDIFWSNNRYDEKFYAKTGKCYDCVIEEEHQKRIKGTFDKYEKIKVIKNQKSMLLELQSKINESVVWLNNKSNKIEYMNGDGTIETWTDISREEFLKEAEKDLHEIKKSIILCDQSISMLEKELNELESK